MLSGFRLETMLGVVRRAALPLEARATGERSWARETVSRRLAAIIAAEVVGYSQWLMARPGGEEMLAHLGTCATIGSIELDKGRALKTAGDGSDRICECRPDGAHRSRLMPTEAETT